jgi:hypothetical protein
MKLTASFLAILGVAAVATAQFDDDVDIDQIRKGLILLLPAKCESVINKVITQKLFNCFSEEDQFESDLEFDDGFTQEALKAVCGNKCLGTIFDAFDALNDVQGCFPNFADLGSGDDDFINGGFESAQNMIGAICARGNGNYCGLTFEIMGEFIASNGTISKADCETIVDSGFCLGTIRNAVEDGVFPLDDDRVNDLDQLEADLEAACQANNVDGIDDAASATEASGSASSASGVVASAFAAVAMVAAAALF